MKDMEIEEVMIADRKTFKKQTQIFKISRKKKRNKPQAEEKKKSNVTELLENIKRKRNKKENEYNFMQSVDGQNRNKKWKK